MVFDLLAEAGSARPATSGQPPAGPTYRAAAFKDFTPLLDGASTLYQVFSNSVKRYGGKDCLGFRQIDDKGKAGPYQWWSYSDTARKVAVAGAALKELGVSAQDKIAVFGANAPEWMVAMQVCNRMSLVCVPLYDTLGDSAVEYILKHSEAKVVFTSKAKFGKLAQALPKLDGQIKVVVYWGGSDENSVKAAEDAKASVHSFEDLLKLGDGKNDDPIPPNPDDLTTIMYTSGTTGNPKGVMITHQAVVAQVASLARFIRHYAGSLGPEDVFLSYLPLAHIFDRCAEELFLYLGASIGYWCGNIATMVDDITELKPTVFVGVPRVFDRIYSGVRAKVSSSNFITKNLFKYAFKRKLHFLDLGIKHDQASPLLDYFVFKKIKTRLGGKVRIMLSGGAPIARHTEDFLRVCFCCPVVQGYGLTETCAGSFISLPDDKDMVGTVGPPTPVTEFMLESVPEMNYDASADPPKGEVLVRAASNFVGYYKDKTQTDQALEKDGWFHTGDVGTIVGRGALKIIDRKKNIFKLAQGEYIAVEKVESIYKKSPIVEQIWVYGDSFKNCLVAITVPVESVLMKWASENGIKGSFEDICADPKAVAYVLESLTKTAKQGALKGFEIAKALHLESEHFSAENDLLTPTFKLKRPQLLKKYGETVEALYAGLG